MQKWEVSMRTMVTRLSIKVEAETKSKATYKAFMEWRGKELESRTTFTTFIKYFYEKTVLLD